MDGKNWYYEKFDEEKLSTKRLPMNDLDGSIAGKIIMNLPEYFDENPEERKCLGWVKHITKDIREMEYNRQTQYYVRTVKTIDDYTVEDVYHIMDKSEEMLLLEELLEAVGYIGDTSGGITFIGPGMDF